MVEPMLSAVDLNPFIKRYRTEDGSPVIRHVSVGGESQKIGVGSREYKPVIM